jgi:lysozyme
MSRLARSATGITAAVALIAAAEGLRQTVYLDPVGIPTVCFGSTRGLDREMVGKVKFTVEECKALLTKEVIEHEMGMRGCMLAPDKIPVGTYVAFTSFTFNVGVGAFCSSTARRLLDQAQYHKACDELLRWVYAKKMGVRIKLPGLVNRRIQEHLVCTEGLPV